MIVTFSPSREQHATAVLSSLFVAAGGKTRVLFHPDAEMPMGVSGFYNRAPDAAPGSGAVHISAKHMHTGCSLLALMAHELGHRESDRAGGGYGPMSSLELHAKMLATPIGKSAALDAIRGDAIAEELLAWQVGHYLARKHGLDGAEEFGHFARAAMMTSMRSMGLPVDHAMASRALDEPPARVLAAIDAELLKSVKVYATEEEARAAMVTK